MNAPGFTQGDALHRLIDYCTVAKLELDKALKALEVAADEGRAHPKAFHAASAHADCAACACMAIVHLIDRVFPAR